MILDLVRNWRSYAWPHSGFEAAFAFIESVESSLPDGKYAIDGENVYAMAQSYETKPVSEKGFEAHRVYADIQLLLAGQESLLWAPESTLVETTPYISDVAFYAMTPSASQVVLEPGLFCMLRPQDAHAPSLAYKAPCAVRKIVVKVRV